MKSAPVVAQPPDRKGTVLVPSLVLCLGVSLHFFFLLSLRHGWLNPLFNDTVHRFGPGADFFSIYAAGIKARHGASLYTVGEYMDAIPYAYAFRYAPLVGWTLGWLLSLLPALSSYSLWLVICECALLRNIRITLALAPDKRTGLLACALWLLYTPYFLELCVGQFTFITASLVFWAYLAWTEGLPNGPQAGRGRMAGDGLFALAVILKMMPLLFIPVAVLRGRWKVVLGAISILITSSWVYFAYHRADWAVFVGLNVNPLPTWHAGNQGLTALIYELVARRPTSFLIAHGALIISVALVLAWLIALCLRDPYVTRSIANLAPAVPGGNLVLLYAACSAAYLLLYKDVWEHHYVLLLPPIVILTLRRVPALVWLPAYLIAALPTLFVFYDLPHLGFNEDPQGYWRLATSLLHHAWKPAAAVWLLLSVTVYGTHRAVNTNSAPDSVPVRFAGIVLMARAGLCLGTAFTVALLIWQAVIVIAVQRRATIARAWRPPLFERQRHVNTCGPAALAAVCRYYGKEADEDEIAALAGTTEVGTSMLGLCTAAHIKGLEASGRRLGEAELCKIPLPAILFFHRGHFAVLTGLQDSKFVLADPALGRQVWTGAQLASVWRGEALLVGPGDNYR